MILVEIYSKTIPVLGSTQLSSPVLGGFVPYPTSFSVYSFTLFQTALFVLGRHQFGVILLKVDIFSSLYNGTFPYTVNFISVFLVQF